MLLDLFGGVQGSPFWLLIEFGEQEEERKLCMSTVETSRVMY